MTKKPATKSDLLNVLRLGLELYETDKSVGKGAGHSAAHLASKVVNWERYWGMAKQAVEQIRCKKQEIEK